MRGWDDLCGKAPEAAARAYDLLQHDPRQRTERNHPLRGELGTGTVAGRELERWQHEVTGAGRLWFLIDDDNRTVWVELVTLGHPKATE